MKFIITLLFSLSLYTAISQAYVEKDIKSFGAKGDGKTNDDDAFQKAADYFNKRGGNGKLIFSKGVYLVGKQTFTAGKNNKPAYNSDNIMSFINVKNLDISGALGSVIKYEPGLRYGAFLPTTGEKYEHGENYFVNRAYMAIIGYCISLDNCDSVSISSVTIDGNNEELILGGVYGDVGRQIAHTGIYISNSKNIQVNKAYVHHFGLDGITIANKETSTPDNITIANSTFEYNARQGFSWVGGNKLLVKNCKFNHTGKGKFASAPGAGIDIEAEVGPVKNGAFEDCEIVDNTGCGLVADAPNSADCTFTGCTFWGTTSWSIWITKPGFSFVNCNIYGSVVHGYISSTDKDATKFINCRFEDKPYNGHAPYGFYLVESNVAKRMQFVNCTFTSNTKKLCWLNTPAKEPDEKYQLINCTFNIKNTDLPAGDFVAIIRGARLKGCTFNFIDPEAKKKRYYLGGYGEPSNVDGGLNKLVYK